MEKNRINFAKHQIFRYTVDCELFVPITSLNEPNLASNMNLEEHGLNDDELIIVLHELFSEHCLVAKNHTRNLFTPNLDEIHHALHEERDFLEKSENIFYGITSYGLLFYNELCSG